MIVKQLKYACGLQATKKSKKGHGHVTGSHSDLLERAAKMKAQRLDLMVEVFLEPGSQKEWLMQEILM